MARGAVPSGSLLGGLSAVAKRRISAHPAATRNMVLSWGRGCKCRRGCYGERKASPPRYRTMPMVGVVIAKMSSARPSVRMSAKARMWARGMA